MSVIVNFLPEPRLLFGHNRKAIDPKWGMLAYGPSNLDVENGETRIVRAGMIGSHAAMAQCRDFLRRIHRVVPAADAGPEKPWKVEFPGLGLDGPLGYEITIDRSAVEPIDLAEEQDVLAPAGRLQRIVRLFALYERKMDDLRATWDERPDIVFLPLSQKIIDSCKDPAFAAERIVYERRTMEHRGKQTPPPLYDFHNALKLAANARGFTCQLIRPATMTGQGELEDPATVAWNFAAAAYYKGTGSPWKLAEIDEHTCIVGVSFYAEAGEDETNMRTSMAHVYVKNAESQIIRGKPFRWDDPRPGREPHLTREDARALLDDVLDLFRRQRGAPRRLVLHKTSPYTEEEIAGFADALPSSVAADFVHVEQRPGVRFYHKGESFPPVRGTLVGAKNDTNYLYTVGFVPALRTYPGSTVPEPLGLRAARLDTDMDQVARDVLALTKLDWNSTAFSIREPVTVAVSRKVGDVLAEPMAKQGSPPQSYKEFM